jgi:hypothetical protein
MESPFWNHGLQRASMIGYRPEISCRTWPKPYWFSRPLVNHFPRNIRKEIPDLSLHTHVLAIPRTIWEAGQPRFWWLVIVVVNPAPGVFPIVPSSFNTPDFDDLDDLDPRHVIARDRLALAPALASLKEAGYYAYGTLDDQSRWTIAVDDELGRVDVRVGDDGFEIVLSVSSPGLYADEENIWKRRSRNRLARMTIPRIAQGFLEPHQSARWDEVEEGVVVFEHYQLPFNRANDIGQFVREQHPKLEDILTIFERQLG